MENSILDQIDQVLEQCGHSLLYRRQFRLCFQNRRAHEFLLSEALARSLAALYTPGESGFRIETNYRENPKNSRVGVWVKITILESEDDV